MLPFHCIAMIFKIMEREWADACRETEVFRGKTGAGILALERIPSSPFLPPQTNIPDVFSL